MKGKVRSEWEDVGSSTKQGSIQGRSELNLILKNSTAYWERPYMSRAGSASQLFKSNEDIRVAGPEGNSNVTHFSMPAL